MSGAALPHVERSEGRPLGATILFVWMVAMWAAFRAERPTIEIVAGAPATRAGIR